MSCSCNAKQRGANISVRPSTLKSFFRLKGIFFSSARFHISERTIRGVKNAKQYEKSAIHGVSGGSVVGSGRHYRRAGEIAQEIGWHSDITLQ